MKINIITSTERDRLYLDIISEGIIMELKLSLEEADQLSTNLVANIKVQRELK